MDAGWVGEEGVEPPLARLEGWVVGLGPGSLSEMGRRDGRFGCVVGGEEVERGRRNDSWIAGWTLEFVRMWSWSVGRWVLTVLVDLLVGQVNLARCRCSY